MTRDTDKNLGLTARANVAKANDADLFLSIHHNASIAHNARGLETLVRPKAPATLTMPTTFLSQRRFRPAYWLR